MNKKEANVFYRRAFKNQRLEKQEDTLEDRAHNVMQQNYLHILCGACSFL